MDAEFFYSNYVGCYPFDTEREREITNGMISHLIESGVPRKTILDIYEHCAYHKIVSPDTVPDFTWGDSITKRNKWYYHHELHLVSHDDLHDPINNIDIHYPFYMEIKSRYTYEDLYNYLVRNVGCLYKISNYNKDIAILKKLIQRYDTIQIASGLDFVLKMIDAARNDNKPLASIFDIEKNTEYAYEQISYVVSESNLHHTNKPVWRFDAK